MINSIIVSAYGTYAEVEWQSPLFLIKFEHGESLTLLKHIVYHTPAREVVSEDDGISFALKALYFKRTTDVAVYQF
jgi:hypothetical protein